MNYKEKYEQALERAKNFKSPFCQHAAEVIFPELKESEDERIRKALLEHFGTYHSGSAITNDVVVEDVLTWLEKQDEQKSTWSEEDECYKNGLIGLVEDSKAGLPINLRGEAADKCVDWLKAIKHKKHWKPSDTQMSMLLAVLNDSNNISSESVQIALKSLYNDLKKL